MKRLFVNFVFSMFMCMVVTNVSAHDIEVKNEDGITIYYNYFNDGKELEVAGVLDYEDGTLVIPEEVEYMNRKRKVTSIGYGAFAYKGVKNVALPNSIIYIQEIAFCMSALTSIDLPGNVVYIGKQAFQDCRISSLTIPNSTSIIGDMAFRDCNNLEVIKFGNGVTKVGNGAFSGCSNLCKVIIQDIASWCGIEFGYDYCSNPIEISHHIYSDESNEISNLIVPEGVTSIGNYAFRTCESFTSISIPNGVTSIGDRAFYACSKVISITIPSTVSTIGYGAFDKSDISTVVSFIESPFSINGKEIEEYGTFSLNTFNNATLYVPVGTKSKYMETAGWKDFLFIEEGTPAGILESKVDIGKVSKRYSLKGEIISSPQKGINIVRMDNGTTRKVVVK